MKIYKKKAISPAGTWDGEVWSTILFLQHRQTTKKVKDGKDQVERQIQNSRLTGLTTMEE